jgi:transforming growth factor-beta-induced protein
VSVADRISGVPKTPEMKMKRMTFRLAACALALGLFTAACGDDGGSSSAATTAATPAAGTIVDVAAGNPQFSILVEAVEAAGLVDTLKGAGPFTVFAPTNDAFAAALTDLGTTKEKLLADTATLKTILTYHVVPGKVLAADVVKLDGQQVATVAGPKITVKVSGGTVTLNGTTKVVTTDIAASNGVIHVIDKVLLPPK